MNMSISAYAYLLQTLIGSSKGIMILSTSNTTDVTCAFSLQVKYVRLTRVNTRTPFLTDFLLMLAFIYRQSYRL